MKYVVDEIIDNIAILECLSNKEKKEVDLKLLPDDIYEGAVVIESTNYAIDKKTEIERRNLIQEKLNKIKD